MLMSEPTVGDTEGGPSFSRKGELSSHFLLCCLSITTDFLITNPSMGLLGSVKKHLCGSRYGLPFCFSKRALPVHMLPGPSHLSVSPQQCQQRMLSFFNVWELT